MASTNKTDNYELNQWVKTDPVLMDNFNADNQKIDEAMKAIKDSIPKIKMGSYVGNGNYGLSKENTLSFDFEPKMLCIGDGFTVARNQTAFGTYSGNCSVTWSGKKISWYHAASASGQLNNLNTTYYYLAIG